MAKQSSEPLLFTLADKSGYVDAKALWEVLQETLVVLSEVDAEVSAVQGGSLHWRIIQATTESPLTIGMLPASTVAADYSAQILRAFFDGLDSLESDATAPAYFSQTSLKYLHRMASHFDNGISEITFATKTRRFSPSNSFAQHVAQLVNDKTAVIDDARIGYSEMGCVEGTIENLIGHNQLYFSLWDALNNCRTQCYFESDLAEEVRSAWKKSVAVEGRIDYAPNGTPKRMRVTSIRLKPDPSTLPQFKGVSINITNGVESSEYVRGLRDDD